MSEENKLLFMQITNCDNLQTASHFLEMCNDNMEQAIQLYFETGTGNHQPNSSVRNSDENDGVRAPMNFGTQRLMDFSDNEHDDNHSAFEHQSRSREQDLLVPGVTFGGIGGIFEEFLNHQRRVDLEQRNVSRNRTSSSASVRESFSSERDSDDEIIMISSSENESSEEDSDDDNLVVLDESNESSESDEEILTVDANGDYNLNRNYTRAKESHNEKFKKLFAKPSDILISSSYNFNTVKEMGKNMKKWILVNVQNINMFESMKLNRDIWSDSEIKSIIKQNFIFVQYDHYQQSAREYMFIYPFETKIPDSIRRVVEGDRIDNVIVPNSNNEVIDLDMEEEANNFGDRLELPTIGIIDPVTGALMEAWHGGIKNKATFITELEMFVNRYVHNNPDAVSLLSETEGQESIASNYETKQTAQIQDQDIVTESEETKDPEIHLFNSIDPKAHIEPSSDLSNTTRIQFRLFNSGKRVVHRFKKSDLVRVLFEFSKNDSENFPSNQPFQLRSMDNTNLIHHLDSTLEDMDLLNSSITVEEIVHDEETGF